MLNPSGASGVRSREEKRPLRVEGGDDEGCVCVSECVHVRVCE